MRQSVAAILIAEGKIFSIKRQSYLSAFPGYFAFVGGKIEEEDYKKDSSLKSIPSTYPKELINALIRELKEELNFDLKDEVIEDFYYLGDAITPDFNPYRFSTKFFAICFKTVIDVSINNQEIEYGNWYYPNQLLELYNSGKLLAVPPYLQLIKSLTDDLYNKEVMDLTFKYDNNKVPVVETLKGIIQLLPRSNTLPPADRTNCFLIGDLDTNRILIDPSPCDRDEYKKLINTLDDYKFSKIFLTHHHQDHHQFSNELALYYKKPMYMSQDTFMRIKNIWGENYFNGIEIKCIKEGDLISTYLGNDVMVFEVPGHDCGQLALAPTDFNWFLSGDLTQSVGTVVIASPEGDMGDYFRSLKRVIFLNPKCIIPSHGIITGGVDIIKKTLKHREDRETQVIKLLKQKKDRKDILQIIYNGKIDESLYPLALKIIDSHIKKIKQDNLMD